MAFIDLEKAFDKVPRNKMWNILSKRGIDNKLIRIIRNMYVNNRNMVISNNRISEPFTTTDGLRQGGGLSPLLFTIFMDEILKKCSARVKKLYVGYRNLQRVGISEGAFADDVMIITESEKDLQKNLEVWNEILIEYKMKINKNKTKVMTIGEERQQININIDNENIEQVTNFNYLGITIENDGSQELEINERIEKTLKLYFAMNNSFINKKEISKETKVKVFKTIYRPVLTYGCESWVLTKSQESKIQGIEMKYLRRTAGVTRRDKIRNTIIREDLKLESTLSYIEKRKLSWWGHLQRMESTRPVKQIWEARIETKRKRGRPRQTWDRTIGKLLKKKGKTWMEAKVIARNRKDWAKFVHES